MRPWGVCPHTAIPGDPQDRYRWEVTGILSTVAAEIATLRSKLDRTIAASLAVFTLGVAVLAVRPASVPSRLQRIADPGLVTQATKDPDAQLHLIIREVNP